MKKRTHHSFTFGLQTICFKRLIFSSLLLFLGSLHFSAQAQYADSVVLGKMARQPLEMVVADFTGDALADFIFVEPSNRTLVPQWDGYKTDLVFVKNLGQNRFSDNIPLAGNQKFRSISRGDYDNDGNQDIVLMQGDVYNGGKVKTMRNLGSGSFAPMTDLVLPGIPDSANLRTVAMQDLNQDGKSDVLLNTGYYLSNGNGTFQNFVPIGGTYLFTNTVFDDLDNDGKNDIILFKKDEAFCRLSWAHNLGGGNFAAPVTIADSLKYIQKICVFYSPFTGKNHLFVQDQYSLSQDYQLYTWNSAGTFTKSTSFVNGLDLDFQSAEMDGAPGKELYGASFRYGTYSPNNGWSFKTPHRLRFDRLYGFGDTDGDGDQDVVISGLVLLRNDGSNRLAFPQQISDRFEGSNYGMAAEDLDQNGSKDVVYSSALGTAVGFMNGLLVETTVWFPDITYDSQRKSIFDINGDGWLDIVAKPYNSDTLMAYINQGNQQFLAANLTSGGPMVRFNNVVRWVDVDLDGLTDFIQPIGFLPTGTVSWRKNMGNLNFGPPQTIFIPANYNWWISHTEDFDLDGKTDVAIGNQDSLFIYRNTLPSGFTVVSTYKLPNNVNALPGARDVNGDGKLDLVFYEVGTGSYYINVYAYLSLGNLQFSPVKKLATKIPSVFDMVDFDGDGDLDFVFSSMQQSNDEMPEIQYRENYGNELFGPVVRMRKHGYGSNATITGVDFTSAAGPDLLMISGFGAPVLYPNLIASMAKVDGKVYDDPNVNCIEEPGEAGLNDALVTEKFSGRLTSTFNGGQYRFYIPIDSFRVAPLQGDRDGLYLDSVCPPANAYGYNAGTVPIPDVDFGVLNTKCAAINVDVNPGRMRRCVANYGTLLVSNTGPVSVGPQTVLMKFPRYVQFKSASRPWTWSASDSTYRFQFDSLEAHSLYRISFKDSIPCTPGITGLRQGIRAWTLNMPPLCTPYRANWDSSSLHVEARNDGNGLVRLRVKNVGAKEMDPQHPRYIAVTKNGTVVWLHTVSLQAGASFDTSYQAAPGDLIQFTASNTPNNPFADWVRCELDASTSASPVWLMGASGGDGIPHADYAYMNIADSFDPNDKQVEPKGQTASGFLPARSTLQYTIRFQNTGNDTAFVVNVVDSLTKNLDITTFKIIGSSHPFSFLASGTVDSPVLHWTFTNINLLPKSKSELKSQGFVTFSARMRTDLAQGARIENKARIFFDFNDPIITNKTLNVVKDDGLPFTSVKETILTPDLRLYPNPAQSRLHLAAPNLNGQSWKMMDITGRVVMEGTCRGSDVELDLSTLRKGLYFIRVGTYPVKRLIRE